MTDNTYNGISYEVDSDGIATITWSMDDRPMNLLNDKSLDLYGTLLEKALTDAAVTGIVITSSHKEFIAGADLRSLQQAPSKPAQATFDWNQSLQALFRRQETGGKPVVAAINGTALGGGMELALAAHYRIVAEDPKIKLGLPEVTLGLLPGAGGTQRLPRLIGIREALPILTQGKPLSPNQALALGIVQEVAPADELLAKAKEYILNNGFATQPWDIKGFRPPGGGVQSPKGYETFIGGAAMLTRQTWGVYPAPEAIMSCVYHGMQMPMDQALKYEGRQFVKLVRGPVAQNMIRTLFFGINEANKLTRRPGQEIPKKKFTKVGVLGAGMMGIGLAQVLAKSGIQTILIDQTKEGAQAGIETIKTTLATQVEKGRLKQSALNALVENITPTDDYNALEGCQLVIEAVFENRELKAEVTKKAEAVLSDDAIFASNTSTLPITGLAKASARPHNFIGLHFFSPVHKMPLVEIIVGEQTSDQTVAWAMDLVKAIRKTPVVVGDGRGFFTSRVFSTYVREGVAMVGEGVSPVLIERAARMAGMPVGPLALADEVSLELMDRIDSQAQRDLGESYESHPATKVITHLLQELGRKGKKSRQGFYDYPEEAKKHLWSGLKEHYPLAKEQPSIEHVQARLLHIQGLETIRAMEEGIIKEAQDADVASILGWGFAPQYGGVVSYIHTVGIEKFVTESKELAKAHGDRFLPPGKLTQMLEQGSQFY